ncbi:hypothetical protein C0995_001919 [Termitomyces sp. Mi166|nr:hypothetical protein C0995_001919 [Termitomyces sp. Mi166\
MDKSVALAKASNVQVGAHPSLPDLQGFGRREMSIEPIKPHGALYAQTARSLPLARAVVGVTKLFSREQDKDISLVGLPGTAHQASAEEAGVKFIPEWFADLEYSLEGNLIITRKHPAVSLDAVREKAYRLLKYRQITTTNGSYIPFGDNFAEVTICVHCDTPGVVEIARVVRDIVDESNRSAGTSFRFVKGAHRARPLCTRARRSWSQTEGEIPVRIIRTAKQLGIRTFAIYTPSDALSLHVSLADKAIPLIQGTIKSSAEIESQAYLEGQGILAICLDNEVTMLHPGYGFLPENAEFASLIVNSGITWLGPHPDLIQKIVLKHESRAIAAQAGIPIVPGSNGVLDSTSEALEAAEHVGYPVILKATAGGGGIGMIVCDDEAMLQAKFLATQTNAKALFGTEGLFIEKYIPAARHDHIEVQVWGL